VLAFLIGGPLLAISAGRLTDSSGLAQVKAERSWHAVNAVLARSAPRAYTAYAATQTYWEPARWRLASGQTRTGLVPAAPGTPAGTLVTIWLNRAGQVTGHQPPLTPGLVVVRVAIAVIVTLAGAAIAALLLGLWFRWLLNRRRLARWAIEWALVGPRWTTRR